MPRPLALRRPTSSAASSSRSSVQLAPARAAQLHLLEPPQAAQPHVEDRFGLPVVELELGHHHRLGLILGADDLDHAIEVEDRR